MVLDMNQKLVCMVPRIALEFMVTVVSRSGCFWLGNVCLRIYSITHEIYRNMRKNKINTNIDTHDTRNVRVAIVTYLASPPPPPP